MRGMRTELNHWSPERVRQAMRVYLVTDEGLCRHHSLMDVVQMAVQAGASCVQLREKHLATGAFVEKARAMHRMMKAVAPNVPLLINDRVDVALAAEVDGVHVGQSDMDVLDVRRLMPEGILGLSVQRAEQINRVQQLMRDGLHMDYLGVGPIFFTATKSDIDAPIGLDGMAHIRALTDLPLVAIGGINELNAASVVQAGADGIAVVSALCAVQQPDEATKKLMIQVHMGQGVNK